MSVIAEADLCTERFVSLHYHFFFIENQYSF